MEFIYMTQQAVFMFSSPRTNWALKCCLLATLKPDVPFKSIFTSIAASTSFANKEVYW
jgi:hypothetical protein